MSPRRWGNNTRLWVYRYLVIRDGERCARCLSSPTGQNGNSAGQNALEIDHEDGNPWNDDPNNLRLLCKKCNVILENKARSLQPAHPPLARPPSAQCVREREEGKPETRIVREVVDFMQGAAEMQANFLYEVQYRHWLLEEVSKKGSIEKGDAINAGAEVVGCSPATTQKYLAKLLSTAGPLCEFKGSLGEKLLVLKAHLQAGHKVSEHREKARPTQSGTTEAEQTEPSNQSGSRPTQLSLGESVPR